MYLKLQNNLYSGKYLVVGRKGFHECNHQICDFCDYLKSKVSKQYQVPNFSFKSKTINWKKLGTYIVSN